MYDMRKERSYWEGTGAANRRIMYIAAGYENEDVLRKPHIGIANTFLEGSPGSGHLRTLAEYVKKGIWMSGGMPIEFGVPATCGNMATDSDGLRYELALRDIVAMSIESVVKIHKLDGLVILASCDNIIAGAYLAALRVHIPCIVVTGGIMAAGCYHGKPLVQADIDVAAIRGDEKLLDEMQEYACPSFGACPSMGTACTMQILGEALNLVLPGTATIPAADNLKLRSCIRVGHFIVEQVKRGVCPEDIVTKNVLLNTAMLDMAMAGSTNAVLHLLAYSHELGLDLSLDDFDTIARQVKCLVGVVPSGPYTVVDFHNAGGVPAVMKRLKSVLRTEEKTLLGDTWGQYLDSVTIPEGSIIRTLDQPWSDIAGLRILKGNLAAEGAVCRPTGVLEDMREFRGRARVFDREELAVRNAVPTAEGALRLAMEAAPVTLHGAACVVTGFGRVGQALALRLRALGADVWVAERSPARQALAESMSLPCGGFAALPARLSTAELVFNTVPAPVLGEAELAALRQGTPVIELASAPGGVDGEAAAHHGIRVILAPGLPGKEAPLTAARALRDTVYHMMLGV